ncbi:MAG: NAD-dependent epimerase/dehydratase family protein, partial [Candidatus Sericytochromatia bacterium]|nr:NAD-dependent epimerase/dehydratase family protein [Candidatus Sericytochromatia bacterium]
GFIGSHLVEQLVCRGDRVGVLDNFANSMADNLAPWRSDIELVEGDLRDLETVQRVCRGMNVVLHLGALGSVPRSINDPLMSNSANAIGTLNVLVSARDAGVQRVVYASSSSTYGPVETLPQHEGMALRPMSPYAVSKLCGELYAQVFSQVYGLSTMVLKYFNVFGPRQNPLGAYAAVIPIFIQTMMRGESPTVFGDGLQQRDFTYVQNVVEANLLAAAATAQGEVCNIACGQSFSLLDLIAELNVILGTDISPTFAPGRQGDLPRSQASIAKAGEMIGFQPSVDFREGLRRTVTWHRELAKGR